MCITQKNKEKCTTTVIHMYYIGVLTAKIVNRMKSAFFGAYGLILRPNETALQIVNIW